MSLSNCWSIELFHAALSLKKEILKNVKKQFYFVKLSNKQTKINKTKRDRQNLKRPKNQRNKKTNKQKLLSPNEHVTQIEPMFVIHFEMITNEIFLFIPL